VAELRNPRIADAGEAESVAGANVLVTIGITVALPERARRRADHEVPPLIDQISDAYRLLYTQLADRSFNLPLLTVVGDEPFVTATVAANIAATVARQVRTTILVDTDFERHSVASVVRARAVPGVADVLSGLAEWPEALGSVIIGRGRTMDVLTSGSFGGAPIPDGEQGSEAFAQLLEHLTRRYECVIVSAPRSRSGAVFAAGAAAGVVVCARTARTPVTALQELATALRARGTLIRGLVVWDREDPVAPTITTLP
jgi:Mrp family chromosome partitioning ATPase